MTELRLKSDSTPAEVAAFWAAAAAIAEPKAARVIKGVPLVKVGEWMASRSDGKTGVKVTEQDISFAAAAAQSGKLPAIVLGIAHPSQAAANGKNKAPAVGSVENVRASEDGQTLIGDYHVGPKWLADRIDSAYPRRSADWWQPSTGGMIVHRVSLLGTDYPAVDTLDDLRAVLSDEGPAALAGDAPVAVAAAFDVPATQPSPTGDIQPPEGADNDEGEDAVSVDLTVLRRTLGLPEDADEAAINKALAESLKTAEKPAEEPKAAATEETPEGGSEPKTEDAKAEPVAVAAGAVAIDPGTLAQLQADAEAGRQARAAQLEAERDAAIDAAVREGKIPGARKQHYQAAWSADADGTRDLLASLAPGLVAPVDGEVGHSIEAAASGLTEDEAIEQLRALRGGAKKEAK